MTNYEKTLLSVAVIKYRSLFGGSIFNVRELSTFVYQETGFNYKDSTVRSYLKAYGGKHVGLGQWQFEENKL